MRVSSGSAALIAVAAAASLSLNARAEWEKSYRQTFVAECIRSTTSLDASHAARTCECMAREMESQVSQDDMDRLSRTADSREHVNEMMPFLKVARTRCESAMK